MPSDHSLLIVDDSQFVQPEKFMNPVDRDAQVYVYTLNDSIDGLPAEPCRGLVYLNFVAFEIDQKGLDAAQIPDGWNAFVDGKWVGTSEY